MDISQIIISVIIFLAALYYIKKMAGCLVKILLTIAVLAALVWFYFTMHPASWDAVMASVLPSV